ncbi:protein POF1B isoform X2 [Alosa sapidissima]|nr:protein POF1B isoform X2 [Alosa sapidissima]
MTLPYSQTSTMYRTVNVASEPNITGTLLSPSDGATYRTLSVSSPASQQVQYINGALDGNAVYGGMRYLVPVQRADSYMVVNQGAQVMPQQVMAQQVMTPVYFQNVGMQRISVSSVEDVAVENGNAPSVFSQTSSPTKSPEPVHQEEEVVETVVQKISRVEIKAELPEPDLTPKLDTRYFGELLAEVYRKNCDIHSFISEHVSKIRGRKHLLDPIDYKVKNQEVEALIPKGMSELTKQQIRYLLQTRLTADKTMRLLLTTFSSLREELLHMQDDLRRLESEKEELERDLSFKSDQALQYDRLIESLRDNNRQLQITLKETTNSQHSLETHLLSSRNSDSSREFRIKELEGSKKALEQENEMLRQKMVGQLSSSTLNAKTEELSRHYNQMLSSLREEKDKELQTLRTQLIRIQTEHTTERTTDRSLELRITELLATLEQRDSLVKRQEEEIKRLQAEKNSAAQNVTRTTVTKRYRNQYPILGLLGDDYQYTSSVKEAKTIVIEKTGEIIKQE